MRIVYILILLLSVSCSKKKIPDDVIPQDKMKLVVWDMIRADVLVTEMVRKDSTLNPAVENVKLQKRIFSTHDVSREAFNESFNYYTKNPGLMKAMLDSMVTNQGRRRPRTEIKPVTL